MKRYQFKLVLVFLSFTAADYTKNSANCDAVKLKWVRTA
jgi:hypothetical protein